MSIDAYRIAGVPGEPSRGLDAFLEKSEAELASEWRELADQRKELCSIMAKLPTTTPANATVANVGLWSFMSAQLSFVDSQMNGILLVRAFQRLRAEFRDALAASQK